MISDYQAELDADLDSLMQSALGVKWAKLSIPPAKRTNWRTPRWLVDDIKREFNPDIDVAADKDSTIANCYFTKELNALSKNWHDPKSWYFHGGLYDVLVKNNYQFKNAFCNPPFDQIAAFLQQALEMRKYMQIEMLLPYRAGTRWFRDLVFTPLFLHDGYIKPALNANYYYGYTALDANKHLLGELRILTKRLAFDDAGPVAAFDCCIVVLYGEARQ